MGVKVLGVVVLAKVHEGEKENKGARVVRKLTTVGGWYSILLLRQENLEFECVGLSVEDGDKFRLLEGSRLWLENRVW